MRAFIPNYQLTTPSSLADALALLQNEPGVWKPFAGGTDLMVLLEAGKLPHRNYINIWGLNELRGIETTNTHITLGALTTYTEIQADPILRSEFPMLCQAASETGGLAIQNRGTIGGNIINASPAADSPPALLAYDAEIELVSSSGSRWLQYQGFHTGYKQMHIAPNELLARIRLPRNTTGLTHYYRKVGTRKAQAISKVCFAAVGQTSNGQIAETRIAVGSVAPIVMRCMKTENTLKDRKPDVETIRLACASLEREISPIDDIRSTANYRLQVAKNLLTDFLSSALIRGWFVAALTIALFGLGAKPTSAQLQQNLNVFRSGIRANSVKGAVIFERGEGYHELVQGRSLEEGDVVKNGPDSYFELLLQPGNYLRGGPGTELRLINDQGDKMRLTLTKGALNFEVIATESGPGSYGDSAYELIRVITPNGEVFISGPGIYRINVSDGRTELIVRKGEAVIDGQLVKKERRAVSTSAGVTVAEIDSKNEDGFDVWSRERANTLVQSNKLLKKTAPWAKREKPGVQTSLELPKEEQGGPNPFVVSAKPGVVTFFEPGVEFSRAQQKWEALTEKSEFEPGDKLRTDEQSFTELMLFPDTYLRLGQASEVLFEQLSHDSISVKLVKGSAIIDLARFDTRRPPHVTMTGPTASAVIADAGTYRIDAGALTIRDGKVLFNQQSIEACRSISGGTVSECDRKRTDNFDFWSRHRGEGKFHNGAKIMSRVPLRTSFRNQRSRNSGFWFQNFGELHYTFVPFTSLLFKSPYGGSYSTVLRPNSNADRTTVIQTTIRGPLHDPPPMPGPPGPGRNRPGPGGP